MKVAFVGAGPVGLEHFKAFRSLDVEVVGLCTKSDDSGRKLAEEHGFPFYTNSVAELYEHTAADAVVAALPIAEMISVYPTLFAQPWASLVEKPLGVDMQEAATLHALANSLDHRGFVGFNRRHYQSTKAAHRIIEECDGPRHVIVFDQQDRDVAASHGHPQSVVSNYMYANSIHLLDYFSIFCRGELVEVLPVRPWTGERGSTMEVELRFASGDTGRYHAVWEQSARWAINVHAADTVATMKPLERLTVTIDGEDATPSIDYLVDEQFKPGFHDQAAAFIASVSTGGGTCPDFDEALRTTRLVARVYGHDVF
jgi:predicted dehydrogenase